MEIPNLFGVIRKRPLILPYLNKMLCWKYPSSLLQITLE